MTAFAEADDEDALPMLRHDTLRINHAVVDVVAEGIGQRVMDDLEGASLIVPLEVFHVFQHEGVGLVMVNQVREFEKEVALFLVLEAVFLAEAEFLGDARDAERLAGKAGAKNVVRRDGVVRHGMDVAVRALAEVGLVGDLRHFVPVGGEDAFAARALEGDAEAADAAEQIDKAEFADRIHRRDRIGGRWPIL